MKPKIVILLLIVIVVLTSCQSATPAPPTDTPTVLPPSPTPGVADTIVDGDTVTIFVDPTITHQTIKDVTGGNFINVFSGTTDPLEPVSIYNLENLDVRVARVRMTLEECGAF